MHKRQWYTVVVVLVGLPGIAGSRRVRCERGQDRLWPRDTSGRGWPPAGSASGASCGRLLFAPCLHAVHVVHVAEALAVVLPPSAGPSASPS